MAKRLLVVLIPGVVLSLGAAPASADPGAAAGTVVTRGTSLNVRSSPSTVGPRVGSLPSGTEIAIACRSAGQFVRGPVTNTGYWDRLPDDTYISDAYVSRDRSTDPPRCAAPATGDWMLPVTAGLISGFRTPQRPAHDGLDLDAERGTPIRAASAGVVVRVVCNVSRGTCDTDGSGALRGCGWYVEVRHEGDIVTRYCHMLRRPSVVRGERVARGAVLGVVGTSGSSSGPHLHFEVHTGFPARRENAVDPLPFLAERGLTVS